ncbi:hypothetical protein NW762_006248 [Fusarium torreyae]|uniref:DUF7600 domain-containing protein n=1 Tax=Fusarium torreyae TaxID=1237075 RepID=A0A9W8S073_9HYPO|nr:hypothetical protein NW762_006248 [Fusarium torreyae]
MTRKCSLCGVTISNEWEGLWLQEFRAIYCEGDFRRPRRVKRSGVGLCNARFETFGVAPAAAGCRYDDPSGSGRTVLVRTPRCATPDLAWGFQFHASCWEIIGMSWTYYVSQDLRQVSSDNYKERSCSGTDGLNMPSFFELCLSMPDRDGLLDWGYNYGKGVATLDSTEKIPTLRSCFSARFPEINTDCLSDPFNPTPFEEAFKHAAPLRSGAFQTCLNTEYLSMENDPFSYLPPELRLIIATLSHSRDVHSLRLASPAFARMNLSEAFWASRFHYENEFNFIYGIIDDPPKSWKAAYFAVLNSRALRNRKRVWTMADTIYSMLRQMEDSECHGRPQLTLFENRVPSDPRDSRDQDNNKVDWIKGSRCLHRGAFENGCRVTRARVLDFKEPLQVKEMSVSFVNTPAGRYISGLRFVDENDKHHSLGYMHESKMVHLALPTSQCIQGWEVALCTKGVKGIAIVTEDGTVSAWAGEWENLPKWLVADVTWVTSIQAEFDALKMVSLSRTKLASWGSHEDWRNKCLWSPEVPPVGTIFDRVLGNEPPKSKNFDLPITTVFFGEADGRYSSSLIEIVAWIWDKYYITGLEFHFTDASHNRQLGHVGPVGEDFPIKRKFEEGRDGRRSVEIHGPDGEELTGLEVEQVAGCVVGLKIKTSFGLSAWLTRASRMMKPEWAEIEPSGSRVVGVHATCGFLLRDLGLISINPEVTDE